MSTQAHGLRRRLAAAPAAMPSAPMLGARSMAIASGKGGVGKTALATSLALSASARGARVLLVDLDLGLANAHLLFGCPTGAGLLETLEQGEPPARALVEARPRVRLVAGARRPETTARLSGAERTRLLAAIAALGRESDLLIVDLPASIGALVIETLRACASPMLVTTPEPAAFADAYALLKRFQLAGAASVLMGLYCLTLPHTPPPLRGQRVRVAALFGLDALALLRDRSFAVFLLLLFFLRRRRS